MYKKIFDLFIDPVAIIKTDGEITATNKSWKKFSMENEGDLELANIGENFLTILLNANSIDLYNGILEVLNGRTSLFDKTYAYYSSSKKYWFSVIVRPLIERDIIVGAMIVQRNISKDEYERFEVYDILESMTSAFIAIDENWKFTYINKEGEKLLFTSREELLGENVWERYPDALNTSFEKNYTRTMYKREKTSFEEYYKPLETWFEINAYPRDNGGISIYFTNINEQKAKEDKLWDTAHHDYLTGIPNRLFLYKELERKIADASPFVIYFLDLNNFKIVNDAYGHDIGDYFLLEISKRLKHELPNKFFLSRFGGDEFVLYTEYVDAKQIQSDAYQILSVIEKPINIVNFPPLNTSASLGVSVFPNDGSCVDSLITAADTAMYEAKNIKGDQWKRYESEMLESLNRRLIIEKSLKEAISTQAFYTVFQPQVDIIKNEIVGIEVLSRWNHPELGFISPDEFITIAEETDQIRMLTEYIIDTCLLIYNKWKKITGFSGFISFNVSSSLLEEPSFISFLLYQLEKHSIPREILEIEITENTQIFSSSSIQNHMNDLRRAGIGIAIDDFGVGYSNLSYITNLPITKLKIDKFFINCIGRSTKGEATLRAIIVLANNLEINVIAEGVETIEQRDYLKENQCSFVQGYLYDKPLSDGQFMARLQQFGIKYSV
ncbi:EAL domain-containing protein [Psychrobacillus sp. PGGUH221]|uniref:EAL domain-containing protein n=1 Tax=Psychrobacillus sp. PGGUH221 TaxID=3020058 RepID=UPI0035C767A5